MSRLDRQGTIQTATPPRANGECHRSIGGNPCAISESWVILKEEVIAIPVLHLDSVPASPGRARRFVARLLDEWGVTELDTTDDIYADAAKCLLRDTAVLLVSELVTNAIVHTGSTVDVVVARDPKRMHDAEPPALLRVEVHDRSARLPTRRHVGPDSESGRGLALVDALAHRWGVAREEVGKNVWFELCALEARGLLAAVGSFAPASLWTQPR